MNPFLLPADERMADWRGFRATLAEKEEADQFAAVAAYWSRAPLLTIAYDVEAATTWPTPWEMMNANEWCRKSVAIGMEATLRLAGIAAERLALELMLDRTIQDLLFILKIDDQWALNYDWGSVTLYPKTEHAVIRRIRFSGRGYSAY